MNVDGRINGLLIGAPARLPGAGPGFINRPLRGWGQDSDTTRAARTCKTALDVLIYVERLLQRTSPAEGSTALTQNGQAGPGQNNGPRTNEAYYN